MLFSIRSYVLFNKIKNKIGLLCKNEMCYIFIDNKADFSTKICIFCYLYKCTQKSRYKIKQFKL